MKKIFIILFLFNNIDFVVAQKNTRDSITHLLSKTKEDTTRVNLLYELSHYYNENSMLDSAVFWATRGLALAQKIDYKKDEINRKLYITHQSWVIGDFTTAIKVGYPIYEYGKSVNDTSLIMKALMYGLFNAFRDMGDYKEALKLGWEINNIIEAKKDSGFLAMVNAANGDIYYHLQKYDSAYVLIEKAIKLQKQFKSESGWILLVAGRTFEKLNNDSSALYYYRRSIGKLSGNLKDLASACISLSSFYLRKNQSDSALYYGNKGLLITQQNKYNKEKAEAYFILSKIYEKIDTKQAFDYYKLAISTRDSFNNQEKQRQISSFKFNEELRQIEIKNAEIQSRNTIRTNVLLGLSGSFLVFLILLFRNYKNKQKANVVLEKTLNTLKSTQAQLIQSEKLASLGELTAGIAHEIQNPLNFVNNFSELSVDLVKDLKDEIEKPTQDKEYIGELFDDLSQNQEKINHHGKRASSIVKGMLEHSRASTGVKEMTDINKLADEYLRLSYHGLRAKNKDFNADFSTDFDENLPKIEVIPQDIGRVLLNLINNAFYAVNQRKLLSNDVNYTPSVSVSTQQLDNQIIIKVKDNGTGMPEATKAKVFQPFFTTKPTGQGTGLGLSLAYDIVTKGHGGTLEVVSVDEGNPDSIGKAIGSEFIITLPFKNNGK